MTNPVDLDSLSDDELRAEYVQLLENALQIIGGSGRYQEARALLAGADSTEYAQGVVVAMETRGLRGVAHEDDRYDYLCGSNWCRCSS